MADYYKVENQEKHRNNGRGWMVATLLLVAFIAGALVMKYIPSQNGNKALSNPTPTITEAAQTAQNVAAQATATPAPAATVPALGGSPVTVDPGQTVNIPGIAKAISPAVVGVMNKVKAQSDTGSAPVDTPQGSGSGVIISTDGYIVTNNHVVAGADSISVIMQGGEEVPAKLIGADPQTDLAVIKIEKTGLTAAPFGDSDTVQVGEVAIAIGNPLGTELAGTVTSGIISAKNREIVSDSGYKYHLMQTDAAINPGNSGGALVNGRGELIGINSMKSTSAGTNEYGMPVTAEGIGFAIPINDAKPIIEQLIANHSIPRPMMGVSILKEISKDEAAANSVPEGVILASVAAGGPAEKAGIKAQDILTELDGKKATTLATMRDIISTHKIGDTIKVKYWRDGKYQTVDVTLAEVK
jgi:serine protease Do